MRDIVVVVVVTLRWFHYSQCMLVNRSFPFSDWMSSLPPGLQRTPLKYLAIPGSHDSGSYSLKIEEENIFPLKYSKFIHLVNNITGKNSLDARKNTVRETEMKTTSHILKDLFRNLFNFIEI